MQPNLNAQTDSVSATVNPIRPIAIGDLTARMAASPNKVLVVNFWATWCRPCVAELPYFEQLRAEYASRGVDVILVSLDDPAELESRVQPFVNRKVLKSELYLLTDQDPNEWMPVLSDDWNGTIPCTTVIVNGQWQGAPYLSREFTYESLEAVVKPHLR